MFRWLSQTFIVSALSVRTIPQRLSSSAVAIIGGGLGLAATYIAVGRGSFNNALLPVFIMRNRDVAIGLVLCCALGLVAGSFPAIMAMRLRITDALRRT